MIDSICTQPPRFYDSGHCMLPFFMLFMDLLDNPSGQLFFASQAVNSHLKEILDVYGQLLTSSSSLKFMTE
jgi:hypothetical protein